MFQLMFEQLVGESSGGSIAGSDPLGKSLCRIPGCLDAGVCEPSDVWILFALEFLDNPVNVTLGFKRAFV